MKVTNCSVCQGTELDYLGLCLGVATPLYVCTLCIMHAHTFCSLTCQDGQREQSEDAQKRLESCCQVSLYYLV